MKVRKATYLDASFIKLMLDAEGGTTRLSTLITRMSPFLDDGDHQVLVCESNSEVLGFAVVHRLPQLAAESDLLLVSQLVIDRREQDQSVALALEKYIAELAQQSGCPWLKL